MGNLTDPRYVWERRADLQILDVREQWEFAQGAIAGAKHLPFGGLMNGGATLDPATPVVVVCKTGEKSELAALMLQVRGYDAYNLQGGMQGWETQGLPTAIPGSKPDIAQAN